jgi:hypothetical protein
MATQTVFAQSSNAHQHGGTALPYPPLPASPTLTNPDMILPDNDYDLASSPDRSQSPLIMWKNAHAADMQFHLPTQNGFPAGPITPTTPIIYGNGTMLSDIGEVTEVESTVGRRSRPTSRRLSNDSDHDAGFRSSPTMGYEAMGHRRSKASNHERRASIESTSTIRTQDQAGLFADFDDSVSVDDSNFQGDDEESVAESYTEDTSVRDTQLISKSTASGLNDTRYSTNSISRRAEQILANAKRRLTVGAGMSQAMLLSFLLTTFKTMEGNLSRARSSLYITSSSSSINSDGSTPSPPIIRASTSLRESNLAHGHSRMLSENSLNNDFEPSLYPRRSASALGAAGGYRQPLSTSKSVDHLNGGFSRPTYKVSQPPLDISLEPLSEDEPGLEEQSRRDSAKLDNFLSPTFGNASAKELTRSASVAAMRDQMKDLKGKISSLREQARADSMKRRSLQSLRTPSPFTHAQVDQWYSESNKGDSSESGGTTSGRNPWNGELSSVDGDNQENGTSGKAEPVAEEDDEESIISSYEVVPHGLKPPREIEVPLPSAQAKSGEERADEGDIDDMRTEDGFQDENEEVVNAAYDSESGESLYHDTFQTPLSHEDREDAFDYEHFFLHSAMGTISQQRLARKGSFSSEGSVETTKGPTTADNSVDKEIRPRAHQRRGSGDTTSTVDSFATATEGQGSRPETEDEGEVKKQTVTAPTNGRPASPQTARRATFDPITEEVDLENSPGQERRISIIRRPFSTTANALHRPSVSSFESTGTNRSFPLVNKAKLAAGVLTPQGSPDQELKQISDSLMSETASIMESESVHGDGNPSSMQMLQKEDQLMVERLVATLGRCVLGLSESGRATTESKMYRRRIDAARRILEGIDGPL